MDILRVSSRGTKVDFGSFGLKAMAYGRIKSNQLEASRKVLRRASGKFSKVWIRIFPDRPYTQKAAEVGMGKGKGAPSFWICKIKKGQILFEMDGIPLQIAHQAATLAYYKLPIKTKFIIRD
jgi:large subunit ribosomal protein L16